MGWITFFAAWALLILLFCWGNKRWQDRMAQMDADAEEALKEYRTRQELLARAGRKWS